MTSGTQQPPPLHDVVTLLSSCGRTGNLRLGTSLHAAIVKNAHLSFPGGAAALFLWNSLISMYSRCGRLSEASALFERMEVKDTVSWNSVISGFLREQELHLGFLFFRRMLRSEARRCDHATLTTLLSVCNSPELLRACRAVHSAAVVNGLAAPSRWGTRWSPPTTNAGAATRRGRSAPVEPNSLTYTSSLAACSGLRALPEGRQVHGLALKAGHVGDVCVQSSLMDMYSKCGLVEDACRVFDAADEHDEVSYTVILVGFAQNGMEDRAFTLFVEMLRSGTVCIDPTIVSAVLGAFGESAQLSLGKQVHCLVVKACFGANVYVGNGLINMYSKCGELEHAVQLFDQMPRRNSALRVYDGMRAQGVEPTDVTFLSLLHACSHAGAVGRGMEFLRAMEEAHGISPRAEHYACVVDMMGRAGRLDEALRFIEGLPEEPTAAGDSEMGAYAARHLLRALPECPAAYVLMANIYSAEERWEERARVVKRMKEVGAKKEPAVSWIEVGKAVHIFVVGDRAHPQHEILYGVLEILTAAICDEGFASDGKFIESLESI
ncbi:unnamed protein product [Spirodela intermedia]|uniref:Uncharacterized protein n=1 Tax=Spirodela intermedia TaxID=51605 RepID=A0A7I8IA09_SPIIN|nr:unnamed protein product [Spirodela intermedia]CAA6654284.1 unnamed protein product [Spirodela intermedia]